MIIQTFILGYNAAIQSNKRKNGDVQYLCIFNYIYTKNNINEKIRKIIQRTERK